MVNEIVVQAVGRVSIMLFWPIINQLFSILFRNFVTLHRMISLPKKELTKFYFIYLYHVGFRAFNF